jgi:energy-coupling factor transporter ATP-binding protein EcfA2
MATKSSWSEEKQTSETSEDMQQDTDKDIISDESSDDASSLDSEDNSEDDSERLKKKIRKSKDTSGDDSSSTESSEDTSSSNCTEKLNKASARSKGSQYGKRRGQKRKNKHLYKYVYDMVMGVLEENKDTLKTQKIVSNTVLQEPPYKPTNLSMLIELIKTNEQTPLKDYQELHTLLAPLEEIVNLIGMHKVKLEILDHVMAFAQKRYFAKSEFDHMVISGPPGCGKTTLAACIAKLLNYMGRIQTDQVVVGNKRNMISDHIGGTAKATQQVIDSALGGVLLIDEAYSLNDGANSDSFSRACIDTINQNLTEKGGQFVCIIVGYKRELLSNFFSVNKGLRRRFRWWLELDKYTPSELVAIFLKMAKEQNFQCHPQCENVEFFKVNYDRFPHYAGSVREFVDKVKVAHCRRVFGTDRKGEITKTDMTEGLKMMVVKQDEDTSLSMMYM